MLPESLVLVFFTSVYCRNGCSAAPDAADRIGASISPLPDHLKHRKGNREKALDHRNRSARRGSCCGRWRCGKKPIAFTGKYAGTATTQTADTTVTINANGTGRA